MTDTINNNVNPETGQLYPEQITLETAREHDIHLDLTNTSLVVDVANIDELPNDEYALLRKHGLGTSDSSIVLGVNPFKNRTDLIKDKTTLHLTAEDRAVGNLPSVTKGRQLEPLIIVKFEEAFNQPTWKPKDMYRHKEFEYLKFNYDGVTGTPEQYIPAEIKVVTARGEEHYNPAKAIFNETEGFRPLPEDVSQKNWSIESKAAYYGMPPYYYTQLQQQILGLNAPFGYLSVLFERDWKMFTFFAYRDEKVLNALVVEGYKIWQKIEAIRRKRGV